METLKIIELYSRFGYDIEKLKLTVFVNKGESVNKIIETIGDHIINIEVCKNLNSNTSFNIDFKTYNINILFKFLEEILISFNVKDLNKNKKFDFFDLFLNSIKKFLKDNKMEYYI